MTARRRGRGLKLTLIAAGAALLLWCGYWFASSRLAAEAAERMIASLDASGRALACETNATGGFPLSLDLDCDRPTFTDRKAGMAVALSRVTASAPLYWPGSVRAAIAAPLAIDAPAAGMSVVANWTDAVADVDAGLSGLTRVALKLDGLTLEPGMRAARLPFKRLASAETRVLAEPAGSNGYRFLLFASDVRVKPAKGKDYPQIAATADLVAEDFGGALGTDPGRAILAWLDKGGTIDLRRLDLTLGRTVLTAAGTLQLSANGLLSGTVMMRMSGIDALPRAINRIRPGSGSKAQQAIAAASMFTQPVNGDRNARQAQVTIRDGVVSIGVIPIVTIPPLQLKGRF